MPRAVEPAIAAGTMSSIPQPTITVDDAVTLRPFHFAATDRLIEAHDDPGVRCWHARRVDSTREARELVGGHGHIIWLRAREANFAVVDVADRLVARVAMYTDLPAGTGEIADWVHADARCKGVASRAAGAVTRWGHSELGLRRILLPWCP